MKFATDESESGRRYDETIRKALSLAGPESSQITIIAEGVKLASGNEVPYEVREITLTENETEQCPDSDGVQYDQQTFVRFETPSGELSTHPLAVLLRQSESTKDRQFVASL
jgi:hypothetical protein